MFDRPTSGFAAYSPPDSTWMERVEASGTFLYASDMCITLERLPQQSRQIKKRRPRRNGALVIK
jgi:hypothetical protein